jgi:hypothetical protein
MAGGWPGRWAALICRLGSPLLGAVCFLGAPYDVGLPARRSDHNLPWTPACALGSLKHVACAALKQPGRGPAGQALRHNLLSFHPLLGQYCMPGGLAATYGCCADPALWRRHLQPRDVPPTQLGKAQIPGGHEASKASLSFSMACQKKHLSRSSLRALVCRFAALLKPAGQGQGKCRSSLTDTLMLPGSPPRIGLARLDGLAGLRRCIAA